jgi:GYF domain 2
MARPAIADPLAEAPEASWYVRPPSGGQYGPAKPHTIREWLAQGRITADSLVWREGWPDWKLAGATFPSLGGPAYGAAMGAAPAAADDPFAVLGPANPTAALGTPSLTAPSLTSRHSPHSRRGGGAGRVMAIATLCLALVVLSALLVYVLHGR